MVLSFGAWALVQQFLGGYSMSKKLLLASAVVLGAGVAASAANADFVSRPPQCEGLPTNSALKAALVSAVGPSSNGGLQFNMWATIVANDGTVCAVAFSGGDFKDQWLASRVISAQKAVTANSLSLGAISAGAAKANGKLSWSTAEFYSATQPGGSLFGLQFSNPVDPRTAYSTASGAPDNAADFGTANDPMVGRMIGGVNVFGGGLALYSRTKGKVGGAGVSGDTSCTDHMAAWRLRRNLGLDYLATNGVTGPAAIFAGDAAHPDNIIFDTSYSASGVFQSASGFGHPACINNPNPAALPAVR